MKVAAISGAVIAALAAGAVATPSFAQPYRDSYANDCRQGGNATAGAVIGGIAGALLGSNLAAHHGGRSGGAAIGGVAGALLGSSIARSSSSSCDYQGDNSGYRTRAYSDGYYAQPSYGYAQPTYAYAQPSYAYAQPAYGYRSRGYDARYSDNGYGRDRYDHNRDHNRDGDWHSNFR
jgi:uncharacterized protein YcfJ